MFQSVCFCRRLEDKFQENCIELKPFFLNMDTTNVHGNRDIPASFICYLGIIDSTLPTKGTLHRASRNAAVAAEKSNINV